MVYHVFWYLSLFMLLFKSNCRFLATIKIDENATIRSISIKFVLNSKFWGTFTGDLIKVFLMLIAIKIKIKILGSIFRPLDPHMAKSWSKSIVENFHQFYHNCKGDLYNPPVKIPPFKIPRSKSPRFIFELQS